MSFFFVVLLLSFVMIMVVLLVLGHYNNQADWGHWGTNIVDGLIRLYCRKFHRQSNYEISLPCQQKILLASNHISGVDPFLLITALRQPVRFMIAKEEYEKPVLNWLFKAAGCIPVDRGGRVEGAFRSAMRAIQAGELVAVFPQGGIHHIDTPRERIKAGIIKLSHLTQCDILPVRISGVGAPGTVAKSVITRSRIKLETHPIISFTQVDNINFRANMGEWLLAKRDTIFD